VRGEQLTETVDNERLVVEAIKNNDVGAAEQVLALHPEAAAATDDVGVSALLLAKYYDRAGIAATLRQNLPEIDLFEAAAYGDLARAQESVAGNPALVNSHARDGFTALQLAAYFGNYDVVLYLLQNGADANAAASNNNRVQALHSAVSSGHADIVKLLLTWGADVNARQQSGYTALHAAAQNGDEEIVSLLLNNGADVSISTAGGQSAADLASVAGHNDLAQRLRGTV
jgi:ankyrin repeat protein